MSRFVAVFLLAVAVSAYRDMQLLDKRIYCTPKWHIEVYYTSLGRDSTYFIKDELHPAYKSFSKHMDVEFIPYGFAQKEDDGTIECEHGDRECELNTMYSCVFYMLKDDSKKRVKFAACEASRVIEGRPDEYKCAEKVKLNTDEVKKCTYGKLGYELQLEADARTLNVLFANLMPVIQINYNYDWYIQRQSFQHMKEFLERLTDYCKEK